MNGAQHAPARIDVHEVPFLAGRESELQLLRDLLVRQTVAGGALVLAGEPGIGKSSLLSAAESFAHEQGHRVLRADGVESEAQLPYAGLHQLLRPLMAEMKQLPAIERDALLAALGLQAGNPPETYLVAMATIELLSVMDSDGPVSVFVDDVQWLDPQTQEALAFIIRRATEGRFLVLGAMRSGYTSPVLGVDAAVMDVGALDATASQKVLQMHAGDLSDADVGWVRREARGNPLALVELPAICRGRKGAPTEWQQTTLPTRLERAFVQRFNELDQVGRDALLVAAVDSSDDLDEIISASSAFAGAPRGLADFEPAIDAGLVSVQRHRLTFRHPLVRSAIVQAEPMSRRHRAHAAMAEVLTDEPYRQTWHLAQSIVGPDDEVADALEDNTTVALQRGAVMSAIRDLERSAQLTTCAARRGHRLLTAAEHAFALGRADLVDHFVQAAARTDLADLDWARVQWLREIFNDGVPGDASRVMELCDVAELSAAAGDADLALNLLLGAALRCWWADTGPAARARVVAVAESLQGVASDPRYLATLGVAEPVLRGTVVVEALRAIDDSLDADSARLLGMAAHAVGDEPRAADLLERAEDELRAQGRLGTLAQALSMAVIVRLDLGQWQAADAASAEGLTLARDTGQPIWTSGTTVCAARAQGLRGNTDRAFELAEQAERSANRQRLNDLLSCVQVARGLAWFGEEQYLDAYDAFRRAFSRSDPSFHERERFGAVMFLAEAARRCGRTADAAAVLAELEEVALVTSSPVLHVQLPYARAVLADDDVVTEALFEGALCQDLTRWPWVRSRTHLAYGEWLMLQGRNDDARTHLATAEAHFAQIGAMPWLRLAQRGLRECGPTGVA